MVDYIRPTPQRNPQLGALASLLGNVDRFARKPFGYDNPPVAMLSDLLGLPAMQRTAERLAYGEPLTTGRGWATRMRPDTEEAILSAAGPLTSLARATKGLPVGMAIKPKGGNWLIGSVEEAVWPFKRTVLNETGLKNLADRAGADVAESVRVNQQPQISLNQWLDQKLAKYIRNEMATPEDPLRALAERGVSHVEHQPLRARDIENLAEVRQAQGFEPGGMGQSDLARAWEDLADVAIDKPARAGGQWGEATLQSDPWLRKVPPETPVYGEYFSTDNLGFGHLADELRNAINPESGLPANLRWKYGDLSKVTVPQAVQRVSDINAWRAAQKAEADLMRANNAATVLHKEYPEQGFRWVELTGKDEPTLADALKYEGETMGHCVGGYCPDVLEGRSRIYSLRDKKGQPHVTVEVEPPDFSNVNVHNLADQFGDETANKLYKEFISSDAEDLSSFLENLPDVPSRIVQIKGSGKKDPQQRIRHSGTGYADNPDAHLLPFIQDFVKSGKWSDVGDLQNTGLRRLSDAFNENELAKMREAGIDTTGDYFTPEQINEMGNRVWPGMYGDAKNFAQGGPVTQNPTAYNPAKIDAILNSLREELHG